MLKVENRKKNESCHKLRKNGDIPAVYYHGGEESLNLKFKLNDYIKALKESGSLLELSNGKRAIVKEVQKDPVSAKVLHISLQGVKKGETFVKSVKIKLEHDENCPWVKEGLVLRQIIEDVQVETTPDKLPEVIILDVSNMEKDNNLHLKDLILPEGVNLVDDETKDLANLSFPQQQIIEEEADNSSEEETDEGKDTVNSED